MSLPNWPEWPNPPDWNPNACLEYEAAYQQDRADAAIARLKVAVEALKNVETRSYFDEDGIVRRMSTTGALSDHASEALSLIGEIPE